MNVRRLGVVFSLMMLVGSSHATAYTLRPGVQRQDKITRIGKGVKQIGFDNLFLLNYSKQGGASSTKMTYMGGPTFRYFVVDGLGLGFNVSGFYKHFGSSSAQWGAEKQAGLNLTILLHYYVSLGGGMFFKPGIGVGGFFGRHWTPTGASTRTVADLYGGTGRLDLGFEFFASPRFSIRAGLDLLFNFGQTRIRDTKVKDSFFSIDGGFNIGLSYVF